MTYSTQIAWFVVDYVEEKQIDVALDDLGKVKEVLEQWTLTKQMGAVKV